MDNTPVEVWPENEKPLEVFMFMGTQWRMGAAGPTGLDYNVLPLAFEVCGVGKKWRADVTQAVRVLEGEALSIIHRK